MRELLPHDIIMVTCEILFMQKCLRVNDEKNNNISMTYFVGGGCTALTFHCNAMWHPS